MTLSLAAVVDCEGQAFGLPERTPSETHVSKIPPVQMSAYRTDANSVDRTFRIPLLPPWREPHRGGVRTRLRGPAAAPRSDRGAMRHVRLLWGSPQHSTCAARWCYRWPPGLMWHAFEFSWWAVVRSRGDEACSPVVGGSSTPHLRGEAARVCSRDRASRFAESYAKFRGIAFANLNRAKKSRSPSLPESRSFSTE